MLGISWHHMSLTGAAKIQPLPARCADFVNDGDWLVVDGCDEGPRGTIMYRKNGISQVATCSSQNPAYVWGWKQTSPSSHCRFKQRDPKSLKKALKGRNIFFVGDSIARFICITPFVDKREWHLLVLTMQLERNIQILKDK
jgi:hypothetical protein